MAEKMPPQTEKQNDKLSILHACANRLLQDLQSAKTEAEVSALQPALEDIRRQAAEGVEWWVGYDTRQAGETVRRVEEAFDVATGRVRPRRKFRFQRTVAEDVIPQKKVVETKREVPVGIVYGRENVENGVLRCGNMPGCDVTVRGLSDVHIVVGDLGAIRFVELTRCTVETGHVVGSVWVAKCERCTLRTRCRQLRIHDTTDSDFIVDVQSGPIIERCQGVRFGSLGAGGMWNNVQDFSWLREEQSPNWQVIE